MKKIILLAVLFFTSFNIFSQILNLKINSKVSGDDFINLNSTILIDKENNKLTISYIYPYAGAKATYDIVGFNFNNDQIIINYNHETNKMYGGSIGTIKANLANNRVYIQDMAFYNEDKNIGVYTFDLNIIPEKKDAILIEGDYTVTTITDEFTKLWGFNKGAEIKLENNKLFFTNTKGENKFIEFRDVTTKKDQSSGKWYVQDENSNILSRMGFFIITENSIVLSIDGEQFKDVYIKFELKNRNVYKLDEDISKYSLIDKLMSENKIDDAKALLQELYFPDKFPSIEKFKNQEDDKLITNIQDFLNVNEFQKALKVFDQINSEKNSEKIKSIILNKFNIYYNSNYDNLNVEEFISNNKEMLKKLTSGKYKIKLNQYGNLFINDKQIEEKFIPETIISGEKLKFKVNKSVFGEIEIKEYEKIIDSEKVEVSTDLPIYKTKRGKYYNYKWGFKYDSDILQEVVKNSSVPLNKYRITQSYFNIKSVNDKIINEINENRTIKEGKLKNISGRRYLLIYGMILTPCTYYLIKNSDQLKYNNQ
jgi:hypothetical protein